MSNYNIEKLKTNVKILKTASTAVLVTIAGGICFFLSNQGNNTPVSKKNKWSFPKKSHK